MPRLDRYQDPRRYEQLAGAYVLGTLCTPARRRFARLMAERPYIRQAVVDWERRLDPLSTRLRPVRPPARVWGNIRQEIQAEARAAARGAGFWNSLLLWRSGAVAALLLAATLLVQLSLPHSQHPPMPAYVAVLNSEKDVPMLIATATKAPMRLMVKKMDDMPLPSDQDLELWCLIKGSKRPWPMGVLTAGKETVFTLTEHEWQLFTNTTGLAVSMEPKGGSPEGVPTGPVMYKGPFVSML
jgi:anti-sigma-K factor RskA